jgi:putative transcriptional regulator
MTASNSDLDPKAVDADAGPGSASMFPGASKDEPPSLTNQFLIAMPGMLDEQFAGSVVYLFEHNSKGAMGLVVNRPTDVSLSTLLDKIELKLEITPFADQAVYFGGPVQTERGFVLHEPPTPNSGEINAVIGEAVKQADPSNAATAIYSSSLTVPGGLTMTTSKDVLEAVAKGSGPKRFIMTLGYAGWGAGQLEEEIALNGWINAKLSREQMAEIIFATPANQRYQSAMHALGFDPSHLSGQVGHA